MLPQDRMGQRILFTPGPLTTTDTVREAMRVDIGSWDRDCITVTQEIRQGLVALVKGGTDLQCTPMQGSGTFAVEAVLGSAVPASGKLLVLSNGAYGQRMKLMADALRLPCVFLEDPEDQPHRPDRLDSVLKKDSEITHVACVHCETTTGLLNPIRDLGHVVSQHQRHLIVDAISTFGAYSMGRGEEIDFDVGPIDHLILSANEGLEGVPGCAFVLSSSQAIQQTKGIARSLSMDLHDQWNYMEQCGRFRFTPPTHVLLAMRQALRELVEEGGIEKREARYRENHRVLVNGMRHLGFEPLIAPDYQSHIITAFLEPDGSFDFEEFYEYLHRVGFIVYPGKLTDVPTFRIANIGSIDTSEIQGLLQAIKTYCELR